MAYYEGEISPMGGASAGAFGGDWIWAIILIVLLGGYGNGGAGGVNSNYVLATDFATIERKIDGVNNGICSLGYEQLGQMNNINTNILTTGNAIQTQLSTGFCQLMNNQNCNTQRILDYLSSEKIASLQAENAGLKAQISNDMQTSAIITALSPKAPVPAYPVFPVTSFAHPTGVSFGVNGGCDCSQASVL